MLLNLVIFVYIKNILNSSHPKDMNIPKAHGNVFNKLKLIDFIPIRLLALPIYSFCLAIFFHLQYSDHI